MDNQMSSEPNEPARAGYDAPRAQRLSDAVRARGVDCVPGNHADPGQCEANGSAAQNTCYTTGSTAVACENFGNTASLACHTGQTATECGTGNSAV
jgi:hypothetical protein